LFSGIGGFDLAMRNLGHEIVGACEIDKYARSVYARQFPGVAIWENATTIKPKELPDFDILCAGFPCQAFSIAGKRRGFDDTRGSLFFEIARIAKEKQPSILFLENVKGLLSHDQGKTFHTILATLDEIGFDCQWQIINSKYFVPQNRERIFIVGYSRKGSRREVFSFRKDDTKIVGENNLKNKTGLYAVVNDHGTLKEREISNNIDANYWKGVDNHAQRTMIAWSKSHRPHGIESCIKIGEANTLNTGNGCKTQSSATFVISNGTRIRRLTPLECERLQGFPDNWTKYDSEGNIVSDTQRYKMCGNAVTVPVVEYIGENFD
jgi:DNA (cytosine-5)-methyltransferase 1